MSQCIYLISVPHAGFLTAASDTNTHDRGLSVPHRAAEKVFPPLVGFIFYFCVWLWLGIDSFILYLCNMQDFSQQPPAEELIAKDLHDEHPCRLGAQKSTWVFSSPHRFWNKTDVVQLLKIITILITTSV